MFMQEQHDFLLEHNALAESERRVSVICREDSVAYIETLDALSVAIAGAKDRTDQIESSPRNHLSWPSGGVMLCCSRARPAPLSRVRSRMHGFSFATKRSRCNGFEMRLTLGAGSCKQSLRSSNVFGPGLFATITILQLITISVARSCSRATSGDSEILH